VCKSMFRFICVFIPVVLIFCPNLAADNVTIQAKWSYANLDNPEGVFKNPKGFSVGIGSRLYKSNGVILWFEYHSTESPSTYSSAVLDLKLYSAFAEFKAQVPVPRGQALIPYFMGGLGLTRFSLSELENSAKYSETNLFFRFGAGLDIVLSERFSISSGVDYSIMTGELSYHSIAYLGALKFSRVNIGFIYHLTKKRK